MLMRKKFYRTSKTITVIPINHNGAPLQELGYQPTKRKKPIKQKRKKWKK